MIIFPCVLVKAHFVLVELWSSNLCLDVYFIEVCWHSRLVLYTCKCCSRHLIRPFYLHLMRRPQYCNSFKLLICNSAQQVTLILHIVILPISYSFSSVAKTGSNVYEIDINKFTFNMHEVGTMFNDFNKYAHIFHRRFTSSCATRGYYFLFELLFSFFCCCF